MASSCPEEGPTPIEVFLTFVVLLPSILLDLWEWWQDVPDRRS